MADLRLSIEAGLDLENIQDEGQQHYGTIAALKHMAGFERIFALLRDHPFAGQERPDYGVGVRIIVHRPHHVLYRVTGDAVIVGRVLHAARDVRRALRGEH